MAPSSRRSSWFSHSRWVSRSASFVSAIGPAFLSAIHATGRPSGDLTIHPTQDL